MRRLATLIIGTAALFSSFATDLRAENKSNIPNFEKMNLKMETIFTNDFLPRNVSYENSLQDNSVIRRIYPKSDDTEAYITLSISCFGRERIMFYYDFFRKRSFERSSFFGDFERKPVNNIPDYKKMVCGSALI